jgi:TonB family protein
VVDLAALPAADLIDALTDTLLLQASYDSTGALSTFRAYARPGWRQRGEIGTRELRPYIAESAAPGARLEALWVPGGSPAIVPFAAYRECPPTMLNTDYLARRLEQLLANPAMHHRQAMVWVFVQADGEVGNARVVRSSGDRTADDALLQVAREGRFTPALLGEFAVPVWVQFPLTVSPTR